MEDDIYGLLLSISAKVKKCNIKFSKNVNKLGLSWAKLSHSWGLKLELEVEV